MPVSRQNMMGLGVADIIISAILIVFGSICAGVCWISGFYTHSGGPFWTGILGIVTGVIGVYGSKTDRVENVSLGFLILNIILIVCTVFVSIGGIVGAIAEMFWLWLGYYGGMIMQTFIAITAVALMVTACVGACNHCMGSQRRTEVVVVNQPAMQPGVQVVQTTGYYGQQAQPVTYTAAGTGQVVLPPNMSYTQPMPPQYTAPQQAPPYSQQMQPDFQPGVPGQAYPSPGVPGQAYPSPGVPGQTDPPPNAPEMAQPYPEKAPIPPSNA